jgi:hypothetical protein
VTAIRRATADTKEKQSPATLTERHQLIRHALYGSVVDRCRYLRNLLEIGFGVGHRWHPVMKDTRGMLDAGFQGCGEIRVSSSEIISRLK